MTNERLTDQQISDTVDAMRMSAESKATLKAQALAGDSAARFTVYGAYRTQNGIKSSMYEQWLAKG